MKKRLKFRFKAFLGWRSIFQDRVMNGPSWIKLLNYLNKRSISIFFFCRDFDVELFSRHLLTPDIFCGNSSYLYSKVHHLRLFTGCTSITAHAKLINTVNNSIFRDYIISKLAALFLTFQLWRGQQISWNFSNDNFTPWNPRGTD